MIQIGSMMRASGGAPPVAAWFAILAIAASGPGAANDSSGGQANPSGVFSHQDWQEVLQRFVDEQGLVNYAALANDRDHLDRYLKALATHSPDTSPELFPDRDHQLAYWLNAYNALVFAGVLDRGPEKVSVWKGGLISGYQFFVGMKVTLGGERTHLKKLEDDVIRHGFGDPRIHAALNCASISCPRLPREAFVGDRLEAQLDAAMTEFVNHELHIRVDAKKGTVHLSKIFNWFKKDFLEFEREAGRRNATLIDYVNRYRAAEDAIPGDLRIRFLPYDKGINAQRG